MKLTADLCLILRLRMHGAITLLRHVSLLLVTFCLVNRSIFSQDHHTMYVVPELQNGGFEKPVSFRL